MEVTKGLPTLIFSLALLLASTNGFAQSDQGNNARVFGLGQPQSIQSLPAGKLRNRLESLPPQASARALRWLQEISFPEADLEVLEIDDSGNVYYADTLLPDPSRNDVNEQINNPEAQATPSETLDDAFLLHSNPGSSNVVFIDFDGHTITNTAWNGTYPVLEAKPFNPTASPAENPCNDPNTFCNAERTAIVDIWHRVSEDLAAYDIDVTTEEPAVFNSTTGRILVTHTNDASGNLINCSNCGGVAYLNVFGRFNYHTYYSPALVFFNKLGNGSSTYTSEASSHEFGHNLGLAHDGLIDGTTYYQGHGSGLVSWAPIMGNSYYNNITEWSKGEYANANQSQDDLAIIDGKLGYLADDHGNTSGSATAMVIDPTGQVISSNPELDPHNLITDNKGIINSSSDVDVFSIDAGTGSISLTVTPAWDAFYRSSSRRGANLDVQITLKNNSGTTLVSNDPLTDTSASINYSVGTGTYYLFVEGVGNAVTPYTDYDSLGFYYINGSVPPPSVDETAPTPNPMTWDSVPVAVSDSSITMTASIATDESSSVEYNFNCVAGGNGCVASGWQASNSHTAAGLSASTSYTYQVSARDQSNNQTGTSSSASATTDAPPPAPLAPTNLSASGVSETEISLLWVDNASIETGYRVERSPEGLNSFVTIASLGVNASSYNDSGLSASTTYDYRVAAINGSTYSAYATASGTTDDPPPPPPFVNYYSTSDSAVAGSVSGSHSNTHDLDGDTQSITERTSGGRKSSRYSYGEHRWNFTIDAGDMVALNATAWSSGSSDGDTFNFEYSANGGNSFSFLFNMSSTNPETVSATIPGNPVGAIVIRVVDTNRVAGNQQLNTIYVDQLYIQVGAPSSDPPIGDPGGLTATTISASRIDLGWIDGTENETGFIVEHTLTDPDGQDPVTWTQRADLPAGSTAYSDNGLLAETTYYFRVHAYNSNGVSAFTTANTTTDVAPALSLSASGYKVKGKHHVTLDWSGSTSVDIYRNGNLVASGVAGNSYDDNIGAKGGASYTHKVCEAGTNTCSNTTNTVF